MPLPPMRLGAVEIDIMMLSSRRYTSVIIICYQSNLGNCAITVRNR